MASFVTIYNKSGEAEKHTLPNARDLIAHSGYSWKKGREWSPVQSAPYARPELAKAGDKVQELLDRTGGNGKPVVDVTHDVVADDDPVTIEEGPDEAAPPPADVADEGDEGETETGADETAPATEKPRRAPRAKAKPAAE